MPRDASAVFPDNIAPEMARLYDIVVRLHLKYNKTAPAVTDAALKETSPNATSR